MANLKSGPRAAAAQNQALLPEKRAARRDTRKGVQSVEIGMRLVSALADAQSPLSLKALSSLSDLTPSKAHRYLASFTRTGLVQQNAESGLYDLGPLALRLGFAAQNRIDPLQKSLAAVTRLAEESGHTAMATAWSQHGPVILRWIQGAKPVYTTLSLGAILPLTRSATGHVYLTHMPTWLTRPLIASARREAGSPSIEDICAKTRRVGYAEVRGELIPGLAAIAAPVFDGRGDLVSVLTLISSTAVGLSAKAQSVLLDTAHAISRELGWSGALSESR